MDKFCIFCGMPPNERTLEHVIPRWLLELTGDPNRQARFGPIWNDTAGKFETKLLAFDQFTFPACAKCNMAYSALESEAQGAITSMIRDEPISAHQLEIILSWLDKVRVGLFLGIYYLQRKVSDIQPHMFIASRVDVADRCLFVYRASRAPTGVFLLGIETPAFQYLPCCFALVVNHLAFFNISTDLLIARRIGLPYAQRITWHEWPLAAYELSPGRLRSSLPLISKRFDARCSQVYQPIHGRFLAGFPELYDNDFVRSLSSPTRPGIGSLLPVQDGPLRRYPFSPSLDWLPRHQWRFPEMIAALARQVLEFQVYLFDMGPKARNVDPVRAEIIKHQHRFARYINRMRVRHIDELVSQGEFGSRPTTR